MDSLGIYHPVTYNLGSSRRADFKLRLTVFETFAVKKPF